MPIARRNLPVLWIAAFSLLSAIVMSTPAQAFCGFYVAGADAKLFNDASVVVLMREGTRTVLSMQNNYKGPPEKFAMVVPVPVVLQKEDVRTLEATVFDRVDQLGAPRLVEYWEQDPCSEGIGLGSIGTLGHGSGRGFGSGSGRLGAAKVVVEAQFAVGEYDVVVLSSNDSSALEQWLTDNGYSIPSGAEKHLRPYVEQEFKFFVAKVDVSKVKFDGDRAVLSPLRFHYDADDFRLPIRLGLINSDGTQDLLINILAKNQRYEVANYPNAMIPTNLDLNDGAKGEFGAFYATLFDRVIASQPGAVVTEYSWAASNCDPCPGGVNGLTASDLASLGADVMPAQEDGTKAPVGGPGARIGRRLSGSRGGGYVLTRLHARYGRDDVAEDLIFKEAPPISGGREHAPMLDGKKGPVSGAHPAESNSFQARYAIRHGWTGEVKCDEPKRGRWGGPPSGKRNPPASATKLASARRGIDLSGLLAEGQELELKVEGPPPAGAGSSTPSPSASASAAPLSTSSPAEPAPSGACACRVPAADSRGAGGSTLALSGVALGLLLVRRRQKQA